MPIRVLDAATIGRIAAGEVVERPASIAKELIENSLDAGATSITIEIKDGGCSYLRVTDNGCGIPPEEARIAFENHATSKISSGDELSDILTLGFRGEALPSIAAVSRVTMTTRQRGADSGIRVSVEGGVIQDVSAAGCPEGTSIIVRDLFFNTPVRRTFLKKPATEGGVVSDMVARLILGNPSVSIRLINNGKNVYHSFGDGDIRHAALAVYGRETAEKLRFMDETEGSIRICGLVGVGDMAKANRSHQFFFINGRVVRSALMTQALESATRSMVMIGQHPMCALSLRMPPHAVDINVHPSKLEVRFRDEASVRVYAESMLTRAILVGKMLEPEKITSVPEHIQERPSVRVEHAPSTPPVILPAKSPEKPAKAAASARDEALAQYFSSIASAASKPEPPISSGVKGTDQKQTDVSLKKSEAPLPGEDEKPQPIVVSDLPQNLFLQDSMPSGLWNSSPAVPVQAEIPIPVIKQTEVSTSSETLPLPEKEVRLIGVFANTYILAEYNDTLIMIDQHAAHERINYQEYERALQQGTAMQQLLTPIILSMSAHERSALLSNQELLLDAGYEIEPFGERDIQIRAVPHVLGQAELRPLFLEMIDRLDQLRNATIDRRRAEVIQTSCKRAVKAGDKLSQSEIRALIDEMLKTDAPPTCPHGRPVLKVFRKNEIERMFKRI